ncbi:MAG: CAP domain-containing protein [Syntrophomonadaceae bacterium]
MKKAFAWPLAAMIVAVQLYITIPGSVPDQDNKVIASLLGSASSNPLTAALNSDLASPIKPQPAESIQPVMSPEHELSPAPAPSNQRESVANVSRHRSATSTPTPTVSRGADLQVTGSSEQAQMLAYINAARQAANLKPVALNQELSAGAALKSKDMAVNGYFAHTSPTYGKVAEMMDDLGIDYNLAAENIAKNYSVESAQKAFMESPGHRANILNPNFNEVGLGFYQVGKYVFVTQWFTN